MQVNECPCKGCVPPKRNAECHSICPEYKEWKAAETQKNEKIREIREAENAFEASIIKRYRGRRKR